MHGTRSTHFRSDRFGATLISRRSISQVFQVLLLFFMAWGVSPLSATLTLTAAPSSEIKGKSPLHVRFNRDVLPALQVNCLPCHNQTRARAGLNLETPASMIQGGDSGTALVPGRPNESPLFLTAAHLDPERIMPPPDNKSNARALNPTELDLLKSWIEQGAPSDLSSEDTIQWQPIAESWNSSFAVAFSNDGTEIAIGRANRVHIYNVETGQRIATLVDPTIGSAAQPDIVGALSFSPDDTLLAVGGFREVRLWRRQPVQIEHAWAGKPNSAWKRAVVSDDKEHIALWTEDGMMEIRRLRDGEFVGTWPSTASALALPSQSTLSDPESAAEVEPVRAESAEPSAVIAALTPKDPRLRRSIADAEHEITLSQLDQAHVEVRLKELETAIQSATEKRAAAQTKRDTDVKALATLESELAAQREIEAVGLREIESIESATGASAESKEGEGDGSGESDGSGEVAAPDPVARKKEIEERIAGAKKAIADLSPRISKARITLEGSTLDVELTEAAVTKAAAEMEQSAHSKSAAMERIVAAQARLAGLHETVTQTESLPIVFTAIEPDNKGCVTIRADGLALRSDSATGMPTLAFELGSSPVLAFIATDSHEYVAVCSDRTLRIKTTPRWKLDRSIGDPLPTSDTVSAPFADRVNALTFSADGKWLATAGGEPSRSGELRVWNVATGERAKDFSNRHSDSIMAVAFSARGEWIATGGADRFGRITPLAADTGSMTDLEGHTHHVLGVAWLADTSVLATAGADARIKLWNPRTGQRIKDVDGFGKEVTGIQPMGLSRNFVAVSGSGAGRVIAADGTKVRDLAPVSAFIQALAVSRDGKLAATGADDGQLRVWNLESGELIPTFSAEGQLTK